MERTELSKFIKKHDGKIFNGREIKVGEAREKMENNTPSSILLVRNLSLSVTKEELKDFFPDCVDVRRPFEKNNMVPRE